MANNQHEVPTIGLLTTEAAFTYGDEWLTELKNVLEKNIDYVEEYLTSHTRIKVMKPQGTFLIWLDFSDYQLEHDQLFELLQHQAKLILNDGLSFGKEGKHHARLNAAAPFDVIEEACQRLRNVFG